MTEPEWNYDLSTAPIDGSPLWVACKSGEVIRTRWLPPSGKHRPIGHWHSLGTKETPLAWTPFIKPKHPLTGK
jgi:hypothetical protein